MTWFELASKQWRGRPLRAGVTGAGVGIATAALFSLLSFQQGYRKGVQRELDGLGAQILLVPKGCPYDATSMALHGASWPCYLKEEYLSEVRSVPGVATAVPMLMSAVSGAGSSAVIYVGVEQNILALRHRWRISGSFPKQNGAILAGSEAARRYGWHAGQEVRLPGMPNQTATVVGILEPTQAADDAFIYLGLKDAQHRFNHPNELTHILIRLADPNDLQGAVAQLRGCDAGLAMNVVPLAHIFRTIQSLVNSTRLLLGAMALVAWLVAGTGVCNTILIAVSERIGEIGVLRAIGASPMDIFRLIWLETVQVCLVGSLAGMGGALAASRWVEGWARARLPFAPADSLIHFEWWIAGVCLGCAFVLGTLAGSLPVWHAVRVSPQTAIRAKGLGV